jgi:hypothetical protein
MRTEDEKRMKFSARGMKFSAERAGGSGSPETPRFPETLRSRIMFLRYTECLTLYGEMGRCVEKWRGVSKSLEET